MSIWNLSDGTSALETPVGWLGETLKKVIQYGYDPIPVKLNGNPHPYANGETYSENDPKWLTGQQDRFALRLNDLILLDDDTHKTEGAETLEVPHRPVQFSETKQSYHWLFQRPKNLDFELKASNHGFIKGWDLKTGNQLVWLVESKVQQFYTHRDELPVCGEGLVDFLKAPEKTETIDWALNLKEREKFTHAQISDMLAHIDPDTSYSEWVGVGMSIYYATDGGDEGFKLWDDWSKTGTKYKSQGMRSKWRSFDGDGIAGGTLHHIATKAGWTPPVEVKKVENQDELHPFTNNTNLLNPHGYLGEIVQYMNSIADRQLTQSSVLAGLQVMALAAVNNPELRTFRRKSKISLYTMLIAPTGAGKDAPQRVYNRAARLFSMGSKLTNAPRSDKDLLRNLLECDGKMLGCIDEAHKMFNTINGKESYQANIGAELLSLYTTQHYSFGTGLHKREYLERFSKELADVNKKIDKEAIDPELGASIKKELSRKISLLENGIKNPIVNLMLSSTPNGIDSVVSPETIESGLMGRMVMLRADERNLLQHPMDEFDDIRFRATFIHPLEDTRQIRIGIEAADLWDAIFAHYNTHRFVNDPEAGGLYTRLLERVELIATILAIPTGEVTQDDIRYALALSISHIDDCKYLLSLGHSKDDNGAKSDKFEHVQSAIVRALSKSEKGLYSSHLRYRVIRPKSKLDSYNKKMVESGQSDIFKTVLDMMLEANQVQLEGKLITLN